MEQATQTIGFGPEALWIALGVLIAAATIALMVMNLIKTGREIRRPRVQATKSVEDRLANDNKRLNELEDLTAKQEKEMTLLLRSQVAMLHHMVDGNNTQALKDSQRAIEEYLLTGRLN